MTLTSPLALALLAMAAPILWFFLRRPPAPVRAVSSLLLARALAKVPRRRKKLPREDIPALLMMLLALLVGVWALAVTPQSSRDHLVILLDDSDQSPLLGTPGLAETTIADLLDHHAPTRLTVVGTAPPRLLYVGDTDVDRVLSTSSPAAKGASGDPSLLLASLCRPPDHTPAIAALSHHPLTGLPADCPVLRPKLPAPPSQAVLALTASAPSSTGDAWIHARVQTDDSVEWTVLADGEPLGTLTAAPDESGTAELLGQVTAPPGATLSLVGGATSASSQVQLPALTRARTLVRTTQSSGYLATLARLHPRVDAVVRAPDAAPPAGPWDLVITDADAPLTDRGKVVVVFGRGAPELGISAAGGVSSPSLLAGSAPDSEVLALVGLETLHATQATLLSVPADGTVLTTTARGPVAALRPLTDDSTAVVVGIGLQHSDLPLRTAFVHLIANLVDLSAPVPPAPPPATPRPLITAAAAQSPALDLQTQWWRWLVAAVALLLMSEAALHLVMERRA